MKESAADPLYTGILRINPCNVQGKAPASLPDITTEVKRIKRINGNVHGFKGKRSEIVIIQ